jgi:hypothetical protein
MLSMQQWAKIGSGAFMVIWLCASAEAKVTAQQAAKLGERGAAHGESGSELTPVGARRSGNAEGSIPPWTGGLEQKTVPAGERHENPFAQDSVLFKITAENYREYEDKLSEGMVAMLKKYPQTFYLPVYRTRRTASYPQQVYDRSIEGATRVELEGTDGIEGLVGTGFPFPIPGNGAEAMWNHITRYRGDYEDYYANLAVVSRDGGYQLIKQHRELEFVYGKLNADPEKFGNINIRFIQETEAPARLAGQMTLAIATLNQKQQPTMAWLYNPGQQRVRRAPSFLYDSPAADGLMTSDQTDGFGGALDRYNWKLIGKKEMYIGYNGYKFQQDESEVPIDSIIRPDHINMDLTRYELHRVWIVEATLKDGYRHVYHKRRFYIDEDSWTVAQADIYDARGQLWRVQDGHITNMYHLPMTTTTLQATYDLFSGRYAIEGLDNADQPRIFDVSWPPSYFTPATLRRKGVR